ncbi:hypothetical protein MBLNU230_g4610t1 [Neophaeotheca triangularis]
MEPTRRASATTSTALHHPAPDALSRSSSRDYVNILEQSAEEMSQGGSDIGEEIRKMNEAEKERSRTRSRQSSLQRSPIDVQDGERAFAWDRVSRSRNASTSSYSNGVAEARWGGYSPGGFLASPTGSVHSSSGTRASAMNRAGSKSSRLAEIVEPVQEGKPLDSPLGPSTSNASRRESKTREDDLDTHLEDDDNHTLHAVEGISRQVSQASQTSFGRRYDQLASEIEDRFQHTARQGQEMQHEQSTQWEREEEGRATVTPPDRPRSADTFQQAELAFKDFDGVHFSPETEELVHVDGDGNEIRRVSARTSSGNMSVGTASVLRAPQQRPVTYAAPPPGENMTYYPAPVPRMLNLPKRLSQMPAANVQAKRRTHALDQLDPSARASAPWLSQTNLSTYSSEHSRDKSNSPDIPHKSSAEREHMLGRQNLPPQLRASVFFDHRPISQDVEVRGESAVATLDSILQASVTAPVNAFTDHPFAGDVRKDVFAPEHKARRSTTTLAIPAESDPKLKKRRSSISNLLKRASSADELTTQLNKQGSRNSLLMSLVDGNEGGRKLQKRRSQLSLATDLDVQGSQPKTPAEERSEPKPDGGLVARAENAPQASPREQDPSSISRPGTALSGQSKGNGQDPQLEEEDEDREEDLGDGEQMFVQPTTLLAELQVRKAKQKSRNRTAANAFPNGMHSTLLQLDAVEEINRTRRKREKIRLAWEDPQQVGLKDRDDDEDDDVPLGVLYPSKTGLIHQSKGDGRDFDRPLGLMARRELEDSEPLSKRRNRLQGRREDPPRRLSSWMPTSTQMHISGQPDAPEEAAEADAGSDEERQGETLGDRIKRLRDKRALDATIADVAPGEYGLDGNRPISTFTDDVLRQFGGLDVADKGKPADENARAKSRPPSSAGALNAAIDLEPSAPSAEDPEDETLGQRRARLKREREANGDTGVRNVSGESGASRPTLSQRNSSVNILATNPAGPNDRPSVKHSAAPGTLLYSSEQSQAKAKRSLLNSNQRASSYNLTKPLVDLPTQGKNAHLMSGGLLGSQASGRNVSGGFSGGVWNNGMGGVGMQPSTATPNFSTINSGGGYFAPATMPLGHSQQQGPMMGYGSAMPQQQPMLNAGAYHALTAGSTPYGFPPQMMGGTYGYGAQQQMGMAMGMPMGYGMPMDEQMKPQQRDMIDRWRMSVAPQ